jgi:hypothetical protein
MARRRLAVTGSPLSRQAVLVLGGFLLGFAVAALISSAATSRSAPRVGDADYALMVADLFDHEKSVFNARERLLQISKNPLDTAEAALERVQRERPEARRDVDSLKQLAQALRQAEDVGAQRSGAGPGLLGLVGLVLASVLLAAGAAWIWKQFETRGSRVRIASAASPRFDATPLFRAGRRGLTAAFTQVGGRRGGAVATESEEEAEPAAPRPGRPRNGRARAELDAHATMRFDTPRQARETFEARYELGDEEFDYVHPIRGAGGELVGACGLSATEPSGDRPGRFYGFTAWLQGYGDDSELSALGLVTRPGHLARAAAIAEWERRGTVDEVESVDRGRQLELATATIRARVTILDYDYSAPSPGSPGYFGRLIVRYEVDHR